MAAPVLAGLGAVCILVLSRGYLTNAALGYSEEPALAAMLIAIELAIDGHPRQAFAVGMITALDRPEIWIVWGPFGLWLLWKHRNARVMVLALGVLTLLLWFVPQKLGSGTFTASVSRALKANPDSATYAHCPFCQELRYVALPLVVRRVEIAALLALLAVGFLLLRRWRARSTSPLPITLLRPLLLMAALAGFGFGWFVLIAIETQTGFAGNPRYLLSGAATLCIAGCAAYGWAAAELGALASRWFAARSASRELSARARGATMLSCVVVVAAAFIMVPGWFGQNLVHPLTLRPALRYQARLREEVSALIQRSGGAARVSACGFVVVAVPGADGRLVSRRPDPPCRRRRHHSDQHAAGDGAAGPPLT